MALWRDLSQTPDSCAAGIKICLDIVSCMNSSLIFKEVELLTKFCSLMSTGLRFVMLMRARRTSFTTGR